MDGDRGLLSQSVTIDIRGQEKKYLAKKSRKYTRFINPSNRPATEINGDFLEFDYFVCTNYIKVGWSLIVNL